MAGALYYSDFRNRTIGSDSEAEDTSTTPASHQVLAGILRSRSVQRMTLRVLKRAARGLFRLSAQIKGNGEDESYEQSTNRRV